MKKEVIIIGIIILAILIILAMFFIKDNNTTTSDSENECQTDSDCVFQQVSCCPCTSGGKEVCMTKANASSWKQEISKCEKNQFCAQFMNCPKADCMCVGGKCAEALGRL